MGARRRALLECSARATSSLPVPDSPVISTVESVGAALAMLSARDCMAMLAPIIA